MGLIVIADTAPADEALVRSLGPDHLVARGESFASAVRALAPDGADALADVAVQRSAVTDAVRDGGTFFDVRGWEGDGLRGIEFVRVMVVLEYRSFDKLEQLRHAVERGQLTPWAAAVLPASRAAEAPERLKAGETRAPFVPT